MPDIEPVVVEDGAFDVRHGNQADALTIEVARGRPTNIPKSL